MAWDKARLVDCGKRFSPSYIFTNLTADGRGRVAYASGNHVVVAARGASAGSKHAVLAVLYLEDDVSALFFWRVDESTTLLVVACASQPPTLHAYVAVEGDDDDDSDADDDGGGGGGGKAAAAEGGGAEARAEAPPAADDGNDDDVAAAVYERVGSFQLPFSARRGGAAPPREATRRKGGRDAADDPGDALVTSLGATYSSQRSLLLVGCFSGEVLALAAELRAMQLLQLAHTFPRRAAPVSSVDGDCTMHRALAAAADEAGGVVVWTERGPTKREPWSVLYSLQLERDYATRVSLRGSCLFAALFSGVLQLHDCDERRLVVDVVTNTRCITALRVHPTEALVVVAGEDCRASIMTLDGAAAAGGGADGDTPQQPRPSLLFSVCVNGVIVGCTFTQAREHSPDVILAILERGYLVQYDYLSA